MVYGYIRVSTDSQDCENQKIGIERKAARASLMRVHLADVYADCIRVML